MTAIIPQVITPDRATGAQVIDGSLKFDATVINRLDFTNSNKSTTFTASMWVKRHGLHTRTTSGSTPAATALGYQHFFFTSDTANSNAGCGLGFDTNEKITVYLLMLSYSFIQIGPRLFLINESMKDYAQT